jgi:hypothetical protein
MNLLKMYHRNDKLHKSFRFVEIETVVCLLVVVVVVIFTIVLVVGRGGALLQCNGGT